MLYQTILPSRLSERIETEKDLNLIDVREPWEHEIASIAQAKLLPMSRFKEWIDELNPEQEIVVMCHHGIRSGHVCQFLALHGFKQVLNLEGGIDLWSKEVDSAVPRY